MCQAWITPPSANLDEDASVESNATVGKALPDPLDISPNASAPVSAGSSVWSARPGQMALWFGLAS
ncbi:MAG TPA: hypothetical protein VHB99_07755, partial [Pirellulales bacterium]|nr:hypothetical protein [Pirellulales bacterium]